MAECAMLTGIDLIMADHRRVEELFAQLDGDPMVAAVAAGQIFDELTMHDDAEQHALYPLASHLLGDDELIARVLLAHSKVQMLIERARSLEGPPLVAALERLRAAVDEHVAEEESTLLPALQEAASASQLDELASKVEAVKQRVG